MYHRHKSNLYKYHCSLIYIPEEMIRDSYRHFSFVKIAKYITKSKYIYCMAQTYFMKFMWHNHLKR